MRKIRESTSLLMSRVKARELITIKHDEEDKGEFFTPNEQSESKELILGEQDKEYKRDVSLMVSNIEARDHPWQAGRGR